jgi:hypothetical protein
LLLHAVHVHLVTISDSGREVDARWPLHTS